MQPNDPIDIYEPESLALVTDGELVDLYYADLDLDPEGKSREVRAVEAEIERRGLTDEQMAAAWKALPGNQPPRHDE